MPKTSMETNTYIVLHSSILQNENAVEKIAKNLINKDCGHEDFFYKYGIIKIVLQYSASVDIIGRSLIHGSRSF